MGDWNLRRNRDSKYNYKAGTQTRRIAEDIRKSAAKKTNDHQKDDTKNRKMILDEIEDRISKGENLDEITTDIAGRQEVKEQFSYFLDHGIKDLPKIFKGWYEAKERNKEKLGKIVDGIGW